MDIAIGIILVIFTLLTILGGVAMIIIVKKRKAANIPVNYNAPFVFQWVLGIIVCLTGSVAIWSGDLFGENTTGIAQVLGIAGIALIATSGITLKTFMKKLDEE